MIPFELVRASLIPMLLALGCSGASKVVGVECSSDGDCALADVTGTCEATHFCSYPDPSCNGNRYTPGATDGLANTCVMGAAACGEQDQPCCGGDLCATDLACTAGTCACGGKDEPCCDGTSCDTNLACGASSTCSCGGIDEPCCGGSTCETGLACAGGECTGGVLQVAVGESHTCALRTNRKVTCWGWDWKPYPYDTTGLAIPTIGSTTPIAIPNLSDVATIRAGARHTCAKKMDGTLWCWGHNESGQLGDGTTTNTRAAVQVSGLSAVTAFDLAKHHTCAHGTVGGVTALYCWGHGGQGTRSSTKVPPRLSRLGNNDVLDKLTPVRPDLAAATNAGQTIRAVATGVHHSCVALSDNTVWCWGGNSDGQLATGSTTPTMVPVAANLFGFTISPGVLIDGLAASHTNDHEGTCLKLSTGVVYCWGDNRKGQLGDGTAVTTVNRTAPTTPLTMTALGGATFAEIVGGSAGYCGRDTAGLVWCWGQGFRGRNGNNDEGDKTTVVQVIGVSDVVQLASGTRTVCAVDSQNRLFCWGNNRKSQATAAPPTGPGYISTATEVSL